MFVKSLCYYIYFCAYEITSSSLNMWDFWILFYSVISYSLSIDHIFLDNQCVWSTKDTGFACYNKCGGGGILA